MARRSLVEGSEDSYRPKGYSVVFIKSQNTRDSSITKFVYNLCCIEPSSPSTQELNEGALVQKKSPLYLVGNFTT